MTSEQGLALALAQFEANDLAAAEHTIRAYIAANPPEADALNLLGVLCKRGGRMAEAIDSFRRVLEIDTGHLPALVNLGRSYEAEGDLASALQTLERARALWPDGAELLAHIGWIHHRLKDSERGRAACLEALALDPDCVTAHANLGLMLLSAGEIQPAIAALEQGVVREPNRIEVLRALTRALVAARRFGDAIAIYGRILALAPRDAEALLGLGDAYAARDDLPRACAAFRAARAVAPDPRLATARLCLTLLASRGADEAACVEEAAKVANEALDSGQDLAPIFSELQTVFERTADLDGLERLGDGFAAAARNPGMAPHGLVGHVEAREDRYRLIALHRDWGERFVEAVARRAPSTPLQPRRGLAGRKLRIGLLSSDLRSHPIAYFALPLVEQYDRASVELYCYSSFPGPADAVQSHIAGLVDRFTLLAERSDDQAAQEIAGDALDLLFDLGGHTKFSRLALMARRLAPVQASWLGYPHSVGLPTIDRILVDPYIKPPDPALLLEQPFALPDSWVCFGKYGFFDREIDPEPPFARHGGRISFGTMNQPAKFTRGCVAAWARVLDAVDGARFVIVRPEVNSPLFRANVEKAFARHGVGAERLAFLANPRGQNLALYNEIDIALDPFPQTGGTTTCESVWMGVPVVSLVGPAFFERLSWSNLSNAGLADLCSDSVEDYIAKAASLAADKDRLRGLRRTLRDQVRQSPLCQTERWVRNFEAAAREAAQS